MDPSFTEARSESKPGGMPQWSAHDEPDPSMVDSLADLFLGDGPLSPSRSSRDPSAAPQLRLVDHRPEFGGEDSPELAERAEECLPNPSRSRRAEDGSIEAVVLGHLPVIASAWAVQYAAHRARELDAAVAFVRVQDGAISIDVLTAPGHQPPTLEGSRASLAEALRHAAANARVWMIRTDGSDEASLAESGDLDTITVLTGSDDAAVVSCYRTLKAIDNDVRVALGDDEVFPSLRVGVMGSTDERANSACRKIRRAVSSFLGHDELDTTVLQSMHPTPCVRLFDGACHEPLPVLIAEVRDALDSTEYVVSGSSQTPHSPDEVVFDDRWDDEPELEHAGAVPLLVNGDTDGLCESDSEPVNPALLLGGLVPLDFECPSAPRVELAIDAIGGLHLVMLDSEDSSAVGELTRARCWAKAHAGLLRRAEPRLAEPVEPVLHVLTDRTDLVRTLIETPIRVHLMAHASTASHGWVVRSINS
ncbi:MAG: hypothetical protein KDB18_09780 [Salinibacterium sp.]|nr:hypothetical protein [Salinibacterium sp.]